MARWLKATLSTAILAAVSGSTRPARATGEEDLSPGGARRARRVTAPALSDSRLPPLTWSDLARPSPLTAEEEALPIVTAVAHRFNPGMAFPTRDIWPVEVKYAWHDGSPLRARVVTPEGRVLREYVALPHERLAANDWGDLPAEDPQGNRIDYYVDAPGDDRVVGNNISEWRRRWRTIMGSDLPRQGKTAAAPARNQSYPPTQYFHFFWFNREKGLLAVQYWFYYPYNEWINHHEGDWEHITVILRGPTRITENATFRPVGYQFFFHLWTYEPTRVVRVGGTDPREDHVMVYAGGHSRFLLWSGSTSGGSYPLPAVFPGAGGGVGRWRPADDTTKPAHYLRPEEFKLVMLPEPDRLDVGQNPELAWLRLSFFAGQPKVFRNPLAMNGSSFGAAPRQPARQGGWNSEWNPPYWPESPQFQARALKLPRGWHAAVQAPLKAHEAAAARRMRPRPPVAAARPAAAP
jgi:hypothetical protein